MLPDVPPFLPPPGRPFDQPGEPRHRRTCGVGLSDFDRFVEISRGDRDREEEGTDDLPRLSGKGVGNFLPSLCAAGTRFLDWSDRLLLRPPFREGRSTSPTRRRSPAQDGSPRRPRIRHPPRYPVPRPRPTPPPAASPTPCPLPARGHAACRRRNSHSRPGRSSGRHVQRLHVRLS